MSAIHYTDTKYCSAAQAEKRVRRRRNFKKSLTMKIFQVKFFNLLLLAICFIATQSFSFDIVNKSFVDNSHLTTKINQSQKLKATESYWGKTEKRLIQGRMTVAGCTYYVTIWHDDATGEGSFSFEGCGRSGTGTYRSLVSRDNATTISADLQPVSVNGENASKSNTSNTNAIEVNNFKKSKSYPAFQTAFNTCIMKK